MSDEVRANDSNHSADEAVPRRRRRRRGSRGRGRSKRPEVNPDVANAEVNGGGVPEADEPTLAESNEVESVNSTHGAATSDESEKPRKRRTRRGRRGGRNRRRGPRPSEVEAEVVGSTDVSERDGIETDVLGASVVNGHAHHVNGSEASTEEIATDEPAREVAAEYPAPDSSPAEAPVPLRLQGGDVVLYSRRAGRREPRYLLKELFD